MVTLSEINITPLLDLAFVLLIIFVITTPLLEKSIDLKLPHGGQTEKKLDKSDIRTVEISSTGYYALNKKRMQLPQMISQLASEVRANPNLVINIRIDKEAHSELLTDVLDGCQKSGITRYSIRTDPTPK
jgi:biopolymer transport protein ExbD